MPPRPKPAEERFWKLVDTSGDCWLWTGYRRPNGYGQFHTSQGGQGAHRVSYELHFGKIPEDAVIRHTCDVPACVRPDHLLAGTWRDNARDMCERNRHRNQIKTHCKNGHEFTEKNVFYPPGRGRQCRTCNREQSKRDYLNRIKPLRESER